MQDLPPIVTAIRDQLIEHLRPERIMLFGSYARGNPHRYSDVNVLIVTEVPVEQSQQVLAHQLFYDYPVPVDVSFCTNDELLAEESQPYSFLNTIMKNHITLYERGQATRTVL